MLLYAGLISLSFFIGDRITGALDPQVLTLERFAIGALTFLIVVWSRPAFGRPTARTLLRGLGLGTTMVVYFVLMFEALRRTTSITTGALFTLMPLLSAAVARPLVGQRTSLRQWAMMSVGAAGAMWVVFDGSWDRARAFDLGPGAWLFLAGCVAFAFYSPLVRRFHHGDDLLVMTFWTLAMSTGLLAAIAGPRALHTDWRAVGWEVHAGIAYLGVVNTAVTFWLAKFASTQLPSAKVMAYTYLTPVFVVLLEVAFGEAALSGGLLAGLVVTASATGLFLASRNRTGEKNPSPPDAAETVRPTTDPAKSG